MSPEMCMHVSNELVCVLHGCALLDVLILAFECGGRESISRIFLYELPLISDKESLTEPGDCHLGLTG